MSDQAKTFRYEGKIGGLMKRLAELAKNDEPMVCPECGGTNLNYDKTICWSCRGPD